MAFPAVTNVDGSNPGPNNATPDTPQSPIGNVWKDAVFTVTLSPTSVSNASTIEQTFTVTNLVLGDFVYVNKPTSQVGLGITNSRVSAAGVLAIQFMNVTAATITPTASEAYVVLVMRPQPNWVNPGSNIDW